MALDLEVGLGPGHIVLDGDPAPLPKKGQSPQFSAHFYCGQTAVCIKMTLGMAVDLSPGDFVFDGNPATARKKGHTHPTQFLVHVYCGQMAGWMNTPLGTEVDLGTGQIVLDVFPAVRERGTAAPLISPMSAVDTVASLSY